MLAQLDFLIQQVAELVQRRALTDRRMGYVWMIVPLLPVVVGIVLVASFIQLIVSIIPTISNVQQASATVVGSFFALYGVALILFYIVGLFGAFALYYLFDRRNAHFKRQHQLFKTLATYFAARATVPNDENVWNLSKNAEDAIYDEQNRPAGIWAMLYIFVNPIAGLIAAYDLTQDLRRHEERQFEYQAALRNVMLEAGNSFPPPTSSRSHKRDAMLFLILTAITGGLFWIYWFYTLLKDYNDHFRDQAAFEDQILLALKPTPQTRPCQACGGPVPENAKFCPFCGRPQTI
jgi:hypothetical protein